MITKEYNVGRNISTVTSNILLRRIRRDTINEYIGVISGLTIDNRL